MVLFQDIQELINGFIAAPVVKSQKGDAVVGQAANLVQAVGFPVVKAGHLGRASDEIAADIVLLHISKLPPVGLKLGQVPLAGLY